MSGALRQFTARKPATGGFDPLSIGWYSAYDADVLALDNGDPVATWPDSSGNGRDASQADADFRPVYVASDATFDNHPTVDGTTTSNTLLTASAVLTQPFTFVGVVSQINASGTRYLIAGATTTEGGFGAYAHNWFIRLSTTQPSGVAPDGEAHLAVATFDGASSTLELDGTTIIAASPGTGGISSLSLLAAGFGGYSFARMAFVGVLDGTLTAQQKTDLLAWSRDKYVTP